MGGGGKYKMDYSMYVLDQFYKFDVYFFCIYIYTFLSVGFSKCKQCVCENIPLSLYFYFILLLDSVLYS